MKYIFLLFSYFISSIYSSTEWKASELAKYINQSTKLKHFFLYDETTYINEEIKTEVLSIMKRVSEENNIVLYVLLLNKINLELEQDNLQLYISKLYEKK